MKVFANDHGSLGGPYPKNLTIALISHREATLGISPQNPRRTDRDPLFVTDSSNRLQESTSLLQHHPARNTEFIIPSFKTHTASKTQISSKAQITECLREFRPRSPY